MAVSADTYAPFSSGAGSDVAEDTWRKFMRRPTVSGVLRNIGSELQVYADSSGRQVKVRAGEVWIEGHWGEWLAESILPVAENASGLLRKDRVVARADFGEDVVELDVVQGTAGAGFAPTVTRNTSLYEVSLGTVDVAAGTTSLAAGTVLDARTYGGPVYPTGSDDKTFFGDKLSSIPRADVVVANSITNGFTYLSRISTAVEAVVSKLRLYVDVAQIAGTFAAKVYKGYNQRDLQEIAAPVMTATSIGVREGTFTPVLIEAGMQVVVAVTATGASTTAQLGSSAVVLGTTLLNTSGSIVTTAFKNTGGAALPSTLDLLDGSWSLRDRVPWVALA